MRTIAILSVIALVFAAIFPVAAAAQDGHTDYNPDEYVRVPFNVGLVHGISLGDALAEETGRKVIHDGFSFALFSGRAARLDGFSFGGIYHEYTEDVRGALIAGVSAVGGDVKAAQFGGVNMVGGNMRGAQFGYLVNMVGGSAHAAQFGGIVNLTGGSFEGAQFSGVANLTGDDFRGAQFSGVINTTGGKAEGAQFAGVANVTGGSYKGAQFGGVANITGGGFEGAQFGGIANITGGAFAGAQFAGIVNVAREVKRGLQIAPINISERNEGIPIGLVSYVEDVGFRYDVWGTEMGFVHAGLRSGNRHFYNIIGAGVKPADSLLWSVGAGLGGHIDVSRAVGIEVGLYSQYVQGAGDFDENPNALTTLNVTGVFDLGPLWITAGPTFNVWVSEDKQDSGLVPFDVYDEKEGETYIIMWPGFNLGVRF